MHLPHGDTSTHVHAKKTSPTITASFNRPEEIVHGRVDDTSIKRRRAEAFNNRPFIGCLRLKDHLFPYGIDTVVSSGCCLALLDLCVFASGLQVGVCDVVT